MAGQMLKALLAVILALSIAMLSGCASSKSSSSQSGAKKKSTSTEYEIDEGPETAESLAERYSGGSSSSRTTTPSYSDPRWPTNNVELNAVPESQRWYNASSHVGTRCTIVGPVHDTYQAADSKGRPIFIHIGNAYPDCVSVVIWEADWKNYSRMISDVDSCDNSWIAVTGYLTSYNGDLQFNIDDGIKYKYWTYVD